MVNFKDKIKLKYVFFVTVKAPDTHYNAAFL